MDPNLSFNKSYCGYFWEALFEQVLPSWAATRAATRTWASLFWELGGMDTLQLYQGATSAGEGGKTKDGEGSKGGV